ncbi:MAG: hypothetical protein A3J97_10695 [Spirochaetes bacterium RIFOXYC1_FULL_54_7]|nr:MAG: hypothetical protein A3J97_10695 [Spirochaetes bacterium RIFOXYC1_FULL_54_7]
MTYDDLKNELSEYQYAALTGGDDAVATRCIERAQIWIKAKATKAGIALADIDWTDDIIDQALLNRALYEMYSRGENENIAKDKKANAVELLRSQWGAAVDNTDESKADDPGPAIAVVEPGSDNWNDYK